MGPKKMTDSDSESLEVRLAAAEREIERLKAAAAQTSKLIYGLIHDMRQPVRAMLTHAQLLQRRNPDVPNIKEYLPTIYEGAHEANAILDSASAFSRSEERMDRVPVNLKLPIDLAVMKVGTLLQESGGTITSEELPQVQVDISKFAIVFEHLLRNALQYRSDQPPQIRISGQERQTHVEAAVTDNGCGVGPEYQKQIFEPFKRLHGKNYPGVGMGLALAQKYVQAHGGTIWVESDGQHGSTFKLTVPL